MTNKNSKSLIRRQMREKNISMSAKQRARAGLELRDKLQVSSFFDSAQTIALYLDLADEIPTQATIELCLEEGKRVAIPCVEGDIMRFWEYSLDCLHLGSFGIREPKITDNSTSEIFIQEIDLILCPGLAFCYDGRRLGRGRAYYDKYLGQEKFQKQGKQEELDERATTPLHKIGVAYEHQLVDNLDCEAHDIIMDEIFVLLK